MKAIRDQKGTIHLVVRIEPSFDPMRCSARAFAGIVLLTARNDAVELYPVSSWPAYVTVSAITSSRVLDHNVVTDSDREVIAMGALYPTHDEARREVNQHEAAIRSLRSPEWLHVDQVRFIAEQTGEPETLLKRRLVEHFERDKRIGKAYLVRADTGGGASHVMLCLRTAMGPDRSLVRRVGSLFADLFHESQHMDILFIDDAQEQAVSQVCSPFYVRRVRGRD